MMVFIARFQTKKLLLFIVFLLFLSTPRGIRIPVTSVKGRCPRPLDDGGIGLRPFIS